MRYKFVDITGQVFERLVVISKTADSRKWLCRCQCGVEKMVRRSHLTSGAARSCGCLKREVAKTSPKASRTHGMSGSKEYAAYQSMISRCYRDSYIGKHRYSERGIQVCDRWLDSFEAFYADMGPCPEGYTLERKNTDEGYSPDNCIWATYTVQGRNRSNNRLLTYEGETLPLSAWAERYGLAYHVLESRLKYGWTLHDALTKPVRSWVKKRTWPKPTQSDVPVEHDRTGEVAAS